MWLDSVNGAIENVLFPVFIAVIVYFTVVCIRKYGKRRARMKLYSTLPGRPTIFLLGNLYNLIRLQFSKLEHSISVYMTQHMLATDHLFSKEGIHIDWIGSFPVVNVYRPETIELVLSSSSSLEKSYIYSYMHKWLGQGLLTSSSNKWRPRRKLLTPCFHFRILEDFLPTFNDESMVLVKKLSSLVDEEHVDILPLVVPCTLEIVCDTVMGVHIGAQEGKNLEYITAAHNLGGFFLQRASKPWLASDFLFNLTAAGRGFNSDIKILHNFTEKVMKEKKKLKLSESKLEKKAAEDEMQGKKRRALMDLLLDMHIDGQQLTEEEIREEVDTFMFGGHDTTATALMFTLYCIGLYPDVQRKIQEELDTIFGDDHERPVTMDDARNMKYLECTLKESQRLFPSVPIIGRQINEDIHYKDMVIPKDTTINCIIVSAHRHPEFFPEPEVFDPDRFSSENIRERHPYAYIPFSAGPRNCIGQKFALLEEKVIIANILRHLQVVSIDPRDKVLLKIEFVMRTEKPIRLKFIRRR